jgi:hypothetical protein
MLLVLPFTGSDAKLALMQAKFFEYVGPYKAHEVLLLNPPIVDSFRDQIQEALGDQFARIHLHNVGNLRPGWPGGCNQMFHTAAYHIAHKIDCDCWYFFEADNTPLKPNWINTLSDEYKRSGRPFMGVIHPTYWIHGAAQNRQFVQDGVHLVGTSIYPKNVIKYSRLFKTVPQARTPWDVYWQWEIVKHSVSTNLMQHEWRTIRYKRDKKSGEIVGERTPGNELAYDPKPVSPDAVVHHGCKDGTLMHIMRGFFSSRSKPIDVPVPLAPEEISQDRLLKEEVEQGTLSGV